MCSEEDQVKSLNGNQFCVDEKKNTTPTLFVVVIVTLLLAQVYKPFSKSMLNRKMVFRVTKSQRMKDKLSFILLLIFLFFS